jgi:AcrR family transcriptional regulator
MRRIANSRTRPYRSELRQQQADDTRARILEAALRVMARGMASLSVPEVAREAGVSVPTIYRHFGTKEGLLAELFEHVRRRAGIDEVVGPRSMDELDEGIHRIFGQMDRVTSIGDDLARVAMFSPASDEARRVSMPRRLELTRALVDTAEPQLTRRDRDRVARVLVVLTASSSLRTWRDFLGTSVDQAADDVAWLIRTVVAAAGTRRMDR